MDHREMHRPQCSIVFNWSVCSCGKFKPLLFNEKRKLIIDVCPTHDPRKIDYFIHCTKSSKNLLELNKKACLVFENTFHSLP